ncbi:MAG: hypothetical protein J6M02_01660 [Clostridia bacterium]|nr:hypothetical protein [Clostridia bacterium]
MPGYLYHLWFSQEVQKRMKAKPDKASLMAGSLIPDLADNKYASHFRVPASVDGFFVPNIRKIENVFEFALLEPERYPMHFGMFSHLYLDHVFIENYLLTEYKWNSASNRVTNLATGCVFDIDFFFSREGIYKAYAEVNPLDLGVDTKDIPSETPMTGMPIFDSNRHEKEWLQAHERSFGEKNENTKGILEYDRLKAKILLWAEEMAKFADEKSKID